MKPAHVVLLTLMTTLLMIPIAMMGFLIGGCASTDKGPTKEITNLKDIEGRWYILQMIGPDGKGYEATDVYLDIKDNIATQFVAGKDQTETQQLRLEYNADNSYVRLYMKTPTGEQLAGEVKITITNDSPVQMLWADRNTPQETLMERVEQ